MGAERRMQEKDFRGHQVERFLYASLDAYWWNRKQNKMNKKRDEREKIWSLYN